MRTMIKFWLHFLSILVFPMFAAGAVAEVPDAPAGDPPPEPTSETGTEGGETPAPPPEEATPEVAKPDAKVDQRALPVKVKEMMQQLQASDPKAHGWLKDVLHRDREINRQFPGGMKELTELKTAVDTFKQEFPDGVEGVKQEQAEWRGIDEAWNNADPKVIDVWVDANPESFGKLMPTALSKFAAVDPQGYQRHMSSIIVATLNNSGVLGNLKFVERALQMGDKETGAALLKEITDWIGTVDQTAKSQPKAPERNTELDQREQKIQSEENRVWVDGTASVVNRDRTASIRKELGNYLKGQEIDDETFEALETQALKYLDPLLMTDETYKKLFAQYAENRDRDGMVRLMRSKFQELLPSKNGKPGPVEKAFKLFFRGATPVKPRHAVPVKPGTAPPPVPAGWAKVAKAPAPHEIDMGKSPFEMRFKQAAVLKNGRKVFWGANAPT